MGKTVGVIVRMIVAVTFAAVAYRRVDNKNDCRTIPGVVAPEPYAGSPEAPILKVQP